MPATISFPCKACGAKLVVPADQAGKKGKCPGCGAFVPVPDGPVSVSAPVGDTPAPALYEPTIQRVHVIDMKMPYRSSVPMIVRPLFQLDHG